VDFNLILTKTWAFSPIMNSSTANAVDTATLHRNRHRRTNQCTTWCTTSKAGVVMNESAMILYEILSLMAWSFDKHCTSVSGFEGGGGYFDGFAATKPMLYF
jgi:hypothetical protein